MALNRIKRPLFTSLVTIDRLTVDNGSVTRVGNDVSDLYAVGRVELCALRSSGVNRR